MPSSFLFCACNCYRITNRSCKSSGLICGLGKKSQILFAWALNASGLHLPDEVGLEIGPSHDINYAVLQIHYGHPEGLEPQYI